MSQQATIAETLAEVATTLGRYPEWEDRYAAIIAMGKELAPYPQEYRTEAFLVKGCQSQVWLHPSVTDDKLHFDADSDAVIVKGLVALIVRLYQDRTPAEILAAPPDVAEKLDLTQHLSPNRANGLASMLKQIRLYALALSMRKSS